ncbi:bifunctional endoribonuclease/protein kinase ire1 [Basidiobolus ranarum]|uniref:non-specific serine/threonine protein kinase n=1 Tax=Basidiobolus ranarum TaxID=34480 RepID=A0ABR2WQ74_9FUNG
MELETSLNILSYATKKDYDALNENPLGLEDRMISPLSDETNSYVADSSQTLMIMLLWRYILFCLTIYGIFKGASALAKAVRTASQSSKSSDSKAVTRPHDPTLLNLILLNTLDGALHGASRNNGKVLWTINTLGGGLLKATPPVPMSAIQNSDVNREEFLPITPPETIPKEGETLYILEPMGDGLIYTFQADDGLQKLPFPVKRLVDMSPYHSDDGMVYVGSKNVKFYAIDSRTGELLYSFDKNEPHELPETTSPMYSAIFIGRAEYQLTIYREEKPHLRWNITYGEFIPDNTDRGMVLPIAPDGTYISSTHDGGVLSQDIDTGDPLWVNRFDSPVISVYDVFSSQDERKRTILSRQLSLQEISSSTILPKTVHSVFIGLYDKTLYALSSDKFPLSSKAEYASIYKNRDDNENSKREHDNVDFSSNKLGNFPDCLLGNHRVMNEVPSLTAGGIQHENQASFRAQLWAYSKKHGPILAFIVVALYLIWQLRMKIGRLSEFFSKLKDDFKAFASEKYNEFSDIRKRKDDMKGDLDESNDPQEDDELIQKSDTTSTHTNNGAPETPKSKKKKRGGRASKGPLEKNDTFAVPQAPKPVTTTPIVETKDGMLKLNLLSISETVLGYGSHGTVVYKGSFDGRDVAVKRLLMDFYDVADHEVKLLLESDDHPNVIRYYCKEQCDKFMYIAVELCPASLYDVIEKGALCSASSLISSLPPSRILYQIIGGIYHLHSLKIVHRDIKPQNILISAPKRRSGEKKAPKILISDFGLCKKLEGEQSSFNNTTNNAGGTIGWRAPECLSADMVSSSHVESSEDSSFSSVAGSTSGRRFRITRAIDIFSTGCVFYYVLSGGEHPFGDRFSREANILKGKHSLHKIDEMVEEGWEAKDLIERMISINPKNRPNAFTVMLHPYFWTSARRLAFLQDVSDRLEYEERDPPSPLLVKFEENGQLVVGPDWYKRIDRVIIENLGKYRKYDGARIRDLLRAMRNKKHHYQDLPEHVKKSFGTFPEGFLNYFTSRFPNLVLHAYYFVAETESLRQEHVFKPYFLPPGEL